MGIKRGIVRSCCIPIREVREAVIAYLKANDMPAPIYVDDTPTCSWTNTPDGGVKVEWTEKDEI